MKIGIIVNEMRDVNARATNKVITLLQKYHNTPILHQDISDVFWGKLEHDLEICDVYKNCNNIICLGGDGTVLKVAQQACKANSKILGLNCGHVGFLCDSSIDNAEKSIQDFINGFFHLEKRMMLTVFPNYKSQNQIQSLNEILITKASYRVNTIRAKLYIDSEFTNEYCADGLIISTPTGSTAYNLSCGGPVLHPLSNMTVITPVGCHNLNTIPLVVPAESIIKIEIDAPLGDAHLVVDGQPYDIEQIKNVQIAKSVYSTNLVKTNNTNFYQVLKQKMI